MAFNPDEYLKAKAGEGVKGGGFDPDAYLAKAAPKMDPAKSPVTATTTGLLNGVTGGFADELGAISKTAMDTAVGNIGLGDIVDAYRRNRDELRGDFNTAAQANPKTSIAANLAGAVVSPLSKLKAPQGMGPMTRAGTLANEMKTAALQGGVFAAGNSEADLTRGEVGQFAADTAIGAATGAVVPPAIEGAKIAAGAGARAAGATSKKLFSSVFGVTEQNASKYLARRAEINAAPELAQVKDQVDDAVLKLSRDVETGKIQVDQAKAALSELKITVRNQLTDAKVDAREAVRRTEDIFKEAAARAIKPLEDRRAPTALANEVVNAVEALKGQVTSGSKQAQEVLEGASAKVDLTPALERIDETIAKLKTYRTKEADAVAAELKDYKDRLGAHREMKQVGFQAGDKIQQLKPPVYEKEAEFLQPGKLRPARWITGSTEDQWLKNGLLGKEIQPAVEFQPLAPKFGTVPAVEAPAAKRLIQGLDQITDYSGPAGSFDKAKNAAFKGVRRELDQTIKASVPEYREAMTPVAEKAQLLEELSAAFGDERKAIGRLGQVASPKGALDRAALARLEQETGRPGAFTRQIDEYTRAQAILKDKARLEEIRRSLPEYTAYRQAMAKLAKMRPDWSRAQLEQALSKSKEARALSMAESALAKAEAQLEPVARFTRDSTEAKLKSFLKPAGARIEDRRALEALEAKTGQKFIQGLEDRAVLDSFSKTYQRGARNTLLWTVIGAVFGGGPGAALGASHGALMDVYGPKMGKAVLDGVAKLRENPSVQTIRSLGLPAEVKQELEREFKLYMINRGGSAGEISSQVADTEREADRRPAEKIKHGTIRDGRIFYGGDPDDPKSWKPLKKNGKAER